MKAMLERRLVLQTSAAITRNSAKEMLRFCERSGAGSCEANAARHGGGRASAHHF